MYYRAYSQLLVLVLAVATARALVVPHIDCGSDFTLYEVNVHGCLSSPCHFNVWNSYNISFKFKTGYKSNLVSSQVSITVLEVEHAINTTPERPCSALTQTSCPLLAALQHEYRAELHIGDLAPTSGTLEWRLGSDSSASAICFKLPIRIDEPGVTFIKGRRNPRISRDTGSVSRRTRDHKRSKMQILQYKKH